MGQKKTVDYQGKKVPGEVLEFEAKTENWNQYTLEDGTSVKMKVVLLEVVRVVNEYGPNGEPVYIFTAQQITGTSAPDGLKKKV